MNYFKPESFYYIIPILKVENKVIFNVGGEGKSLYEYVKDTFPILRILDNERMEYLYNRQDSFKIPTELTFGYKKRCSLVKDSLEHLNLPEYILAIGNNDRLIEPVTKTEISCKDIYYNVLNSYRVSDCELEKYYISDYEEKINNFFNPTEDIIHESRKERLDFIESFDTSDVKVMCMKKGKNNNDN